MAYKLTKGIDSLAEYNLGGISHIWLLNIDDFISYRFKDDGLHNSSYVEAIYKENPFLELGSVEETNLKESLANGIYKQEINTSIRTLNNEIFDWLRYASCGRYVVVLRTMDNRHFVFGSDGGAKLSYSGQTGQKGELNGTVIKIEKSSVYPLFEINPDTLRTRVLGNESLFYMATEHSNNETINYLIEIS